MNSVGAQPIPTLNDECFACGEDNACGLKLKFVDDFNSASAHWSPPDFSQSFKGTVHGGVIATVLDEAMSKAIIARNWSAFTAELRLRYKSRIAPGDDLYVRGWVVQRRKRMITAEANVTSANGEELAHAWGTFLISTMT